MGAKRRRPTRTASYIKARPGDTMRPSVVRVAANMSLQGRLSNFVGTQSIRPRPPPNVLIQNASVSEFDSALSNCSS